MRVLRTRMHRTHACACAVHVPHLQNTRVYPATTHKRGAVQLGEPYLQSIRTRLVRSKNMGGKQSHHHHHHKEGGAHAKPSEPKAEATATATESGVCKADGCHPYTSKVLARRKMLS